jgi:hypothetical protein
MSSIIANNIQLWRQKSRDGTITLEETRQAIAAIRKERTAASTVSAGSREKKATAKVKAAPIDSNDLLSELGL